MEEKELLEKKVSAISLGCDKNIVDLEHMLGKIRDYGFTVIDDINEAEIIIVNTCSFIAPAVKEAIDNILIAINQKKLKCEKVIVTGCLTERYYDDIKKEFPEVDAFVKIKDNDTILSVIFDVYNVEYKNKYRGNERLLTTYSHYAYLKIADGCNNGCAYCTIPRIRGRYRSVPMDDLIKEAKELAGNGVKELIIVAQDITRYGEDLYKKNSLIELLDKLSKIKGIEWIRLHYCYPEMVTDELLELIENNPKICKYLDIPLQHIDNKILKDMNRNCDEKQTRELISKIKTNYPNIAIRSTYIVGFPGETHYQFKKLVNFVKESKLNNVGFFPFYREEKTKAYYMLGQVPNFIKKHRLKKIEKVQQEVADNLNNARVGQVVKVLIDYFDETNGNFYGRDEYQSPQVDFIFEIQDNNNIECGKFYNVKILSYNDGVFKGEIE